MFSKIVFTISLNKKTILDWKHYLKHFLKKRFSKTHFFHYWFFIIICYHYLNCMNRQLLWTFTNIVYLSATQSVTLLKKSYMLSSNQLLVLLILCFSWLFSKYVMKILSRLPPPEPAKYVNKLQKVGFLFKCI